MSLGEYMQIDLFKQRLAHKSIECPGLNYILGWMSYSDPVDDVFGLARHHIYKNRLYQLLLTNDRSVNGLWEIRSLFIHPKHRIDKAGREIVDTVFMYPGEYIPEILEAEEKSFEDALLTKGMITEEERQFIIYSRNLKFSNSFNEGLIKLKWITYS